MKFLKLFIVLLVAFSISCEKADECPKEFTVFGKTLPYSDLYKKGDTIILSTEFSNMIYSKDLKKEFDFTKVELNFGFRIFRVDSPNTGYYSSATDYCNIIRLDTLPFEVIHFSSGNSMLFGSIIIKKGINSNSISIILTEAGTFMLSYGVFTNESIEDFQNNCKGNTYDLSTRLNNNKDNNINLLKESPNEHFNTWMIVEPNRFYYQKSGFAYRVVE